MAEIAEGRVRRSVDLLQSFTQHLGEGLVATDGVVYGDVGTVGTTAHWTAFSQLIDAGFDLALKELEVGLTVKTTHLGSAAGSMTGLWQARSEWYDPVGTSRTTSYVNLMGTYARSVGSAVGNTYEETWEGYVPVGSVPNAPVRIQFLSAKKNNDYTVKVKNDSYVRMVGIVIPGA